MFQQRKPHVVPAIAASQNENQAKEKLATFVYEYLVHAGASKTAEMFKSEMLSQQNIGPLEPHSGPGFLQDWFCVFWDLYCAAPERRDKFEPSQEAKAFHEYGFIPPSAYPGPLMNGMHGPPQFGNGAPGGMGMPPNGEGMVSNYFQRPGPGNQPGPSVQSNQASPIAGPQRYGPQGARSGAPTPSSVMGGNGREFGNFPPGAPPPHMFNEQQMRNMQAAAAAGQRMPPNPRIPTNFSQMRHMRPGPYGGQFLDSPSGTPPFPQNPMMQNGAMCPPVSLMSSPGGPPPPGSVPTNPDGTPQQPHDPRFMMPGASSVPPQFGMSHHDGSGTPTSSGGGPTSVPGLNGGMGMQQPPTSEGGGQLQSLLNGSDSMDMKHSPASVHGSGVVNGGTPGGHTNPGSIQQNQGGPSSVHGCHQGPGSVHSQSGAPNSQQQSHQTPTESTGAPSNQMDQFQMGVPTGGDANEAASEISKIKASLITDFPTSNY